MKSLLRTPNQKGLECCPSHVGLTRRRSPVQAWTTSRKSLTKWCLYLTEIKMTHFFPVLSNICDENTASEPYYPGAKVFDPLGICSVFTTRMRKSICLKALPKSIWAAMGQAWDNDLSLEHSKFFSDWFFELRDFIFSQML